ncbi:pilus assembly protein [Halomonas sp. SpR1]|uniref:pilus assembly protein n=1 Tax=Halomonas sp. SpR1 TaxID=3050462 RepID=UPI0027E4A769|nr:pilus assembly protein [Halomonas sp. SpR1]MDQ7735546.1 pilus assembly protein [Halomonas sp. SpR1]
MKKITYQEKLAPKKNQLGQGMVEYIIIVALIALAAIGAFTFFGDTIRGQTAQMANQVAGENNTTGSEAAKDGADSANTEAGADYNLSNFDEADGQGGGGE